MLKLEEKLHGVGTDRCKAFPGLNYWLGVVSWLGPVPYTYRKHICFYIFIRINISPKNLYIYKFLGPSTTGTSEWPESEFNFENGTLGIQWCFNTL